MKQGDITLRLPAAWRQAADDLQRSGEVSGTSSRALRIERLPRAVDALNAIAASLPVAYGWRFITAENFTALVRSKAGAGASVSELNRLYWRDMLSTIEAYTVMSVWRMVDICQSAFTCMEDEAIVPCTILARSALESSVQFVQDARTISASLEQVLKHDLSAAIATSTELEQYLLQTVYASRRSGDEEIYKSKNILTVLDKISKAAKDEPLKEEYELLCEVTHPNFLGRSSYLVRVETDWEDGSELRIISPENGVTSDELLQSALWALSWSIEAQGTATHLVQGALAEMMAVLAPAAGQRH